MKLIKYTITNKNGNIEYSNYSSIRFALQGIVGGFWIYDFLKNAYILKKAIQNKFI